MLVQSAKVDAFDFGRLSTLSSWRFSLRPRKMASQKATIEAEIQHRKTLYHHILHGLRNRVTHNLMEETKVMVYKAVCTITLQERGVGYISMSSEVHQDIPPTLSKKDSLYPMGRSPPQRQCLLGGSVGDWPLS